MTTYQPGDLVKITCPDPLARDGVYRWIMNLKPGVDSIERKVGDILEVVCDGVLRGNKVDNEWVSWKAEGAMGGIKGIRKNCIELYLRKVQTQTHPCNCSIGVLMSQGCQCGGV